MPSANTTDGIIPMDSTKMASSTVHRKQVVLSKASQHLLDIEAKYTAGGFTPLPGFFERALGSQLWVCAPPQRRRMLTDRELIRG